jgi:glutamine synthetase
MAILTYLWLDGYEVKNIRSKIKIHDFDPSDALSSVDAFPQWSFDGSSTQQADGSKSDCILKPVYVCENPIFPRKFSFETQGVESYIVLCEVMNPDGTPHVSNTRAKLRETYEKYQSADMWLGMEQEYTIYERDGVVPYKWPQGFPEPQGRYYCGVGADVAWGRGISDDHLIACLNCDIKISGTNAEVMPSQWEYQIGPVDVLEGSDQMWVARFLLNMIAEQYNATIKLSPKPMKGDWNGAGCHFNFSTQKMRESLTKDEIDAICQALQARHKEHIAVYGKDNTLRLTGRHETCSINQFRWGVSDRGASIRIPTTAVENGKGYLEDRRPAANMDPYEVSNILMETVCGVEDKSMVGTA